VIKKKQCKGCGWAGLNRRLQWQKLGEYLVPEALPRGGNLIDEKARRNGVVVASRKEGRSRLKSWVCCLQSLMVLGFSVLLPLSLYFPVFKQF